MGGYVVLFMCCVEVFCVVVWCVNGVLFRCVVLSCVVSCIVLCWVVWNCVWGNV